MAKSRGGSGRRERRRSGGLIWRWGAGRIRRRSRGGPSPRCNTRERRHAGAALRPREGRWGPPGTASRRWTPCGASSSCLASQPVPCVSSREIARVGTEVLQNEMLMPSSVCWTPVFGSSSPNFDIHFSIHNLNRFTSQNFWLGAEAEWIMAAFVESLLGLLAGKNPSSDPYGGLKGIGPTTLIQNHLIFRPLLKNQRI